MVELSKSIAERIVLDGNSRPVCITERSIEVSSPFCQHFYEAFQELQGNNAIPKLNQVVQFVNVSYPGAMENEFMEITQRIYKNGSYEPDSFITFSEYIFEIINSVSFYVCMICIHILLTKNFQRILKGYLDNSTISVYTVGELFDQNQAYLEGRVKGLWATNMFSIGFMSLLHIVLNKMVDFPSWEGALISTPGIKNICDPGTYHSNFTTTSYCQGSNGNTQKSIQCIQCPENMYTDLPDQGQCKSCEFGYFSLPGSTSCTTCYAKFDNTTSSNVINNSCLAYIDSQASEKRQLYMSIFIPLGVFLLLLSAALLYRFLRNRWLIQRASGSDEDWLLFFNELVKPPIHKLENNATTAASAGVGASISQKSSLSRPEFPLKSRSNTSAMNVNDWNLYNETQEGGFVEKNKTTCTGIGEIIAPPYYHSRSSSDLHGNEIHHHQRGAKGGGIGGGIRGGEKEEARGAAPPLSAAGIVGGSLFISNINNRKSGAITATTTSATLALTAIASSNKIDNRLITGKPEFMHALGLQ